MLDVEKKKLEFSLMGSIYIKKQKPCHHLSIISIPKCSWALIYMRRYNWRYHWSCEWESHISLCNVLHPSMSAWIIVVEKEEENIFSIAPYLEDMLVLASTVIDMCILGRK